MKKKKYQPTTKDWLKGIVAVAALIAFLIWIRSWWGVIVIPFVFDAYVTHLIPWTWWKDVENPIVRTIMSWVDAIVFALVAVYFVNIYFFQNYTIPSSSLEKSLLVGDYLYVSKMSYGPRIPQTPLHMPLCQHTLPWGGKSYIEKPQWEYKRVTPKPVKLNDIVVFNYPAGDTILTVNGQNASTWTSFQTILSDMRTRAEDSYVDRNMQVVIGRPGVGRDTLSVTADDKFRIGIVHHTDEYEPVDIEYGFFSSIPAGIRYGWNTLKSYVGDFRYVFTKEGAKSLGGFGTIGSIFPSTWNWHAFWLMTAFLSIILAFMNILPIPALDGGYVLFLLVEVITGKKPGDKFLEIANTVGMIILFGLLIFANLNDVIRLF